MSFHALNYHSQKISVSDGFTSDKVHLRQKRVSNACVRCRKRKIRCDAAFLGVPCVNCRHDEFSCELIAAKKLRGYDSNMSYEPAKV